MKRQSWLLAAIWLAIGASCVQAYIVQSGDLTSHIDSIIGDMPTTYGGGDYLQPNAESRALWREIIDHILAEEYADAHTKALTKNYQVVLFSDTADPDSVVHIVLERTPESTSRYWGTFVFNTAPLRSNLVIESVHPRYDMNTGYQSIRIYQHTEARAFCVSGTHRCNGLSASTCDGTTTACSGSSEPYRYSDHAHVVTATIHITTEAMLDDNPELLVIQPHGFAQEAGDPDLIISNGTRFSPPGTDYALAISDAIQIIDPSLTTKVGHIDLDWTRLLGTTNTQGRLINASSDPCEDPSITATGQFVHVEQARIGLRDTPENWMKLAQAVADAVPSDSGIPRNLPGKPAARILGSYPNPFRQQTQIDLEIGRTGPIHLEVFDVAGRRKATLVNGSYEAGIVRAVWDARQTPPGVYFIRLRHGRAKLDIQKVTLLH